MDIIIGLGQSLAVVGSRTFNNEKLCHEIIEDVIDEYNLEIVKFVSGGAKGADTFGEHWADLHNIEKQIFYPDWKTYGKKAGFLRNVDIIKNCDVCVAFWDGQSHGTKHDIELCEKYKKKCIVYNYVTDDLYEHC